MELTEEELAVLLSPIPYPNNTWSTEADVPLGVRVIDTSDGDKVKQKIGTELAPVADLIYINGSVLVDSIGNAIWDDTENQILTSSNGEVLISQEGLILEGAL